MTKAEIIEMLATSPEHARKLNTFRKPELEQFLEAQTSPQNHEEFPIGSYVYCEWAGSKGIVTATEKIPGRADGRYNLTVKTGSSNRLQTHSGDVIRYQG